MEFTTSDLILRPATVSDYDGILGITEGEDLWGGLDYLPFALRKWLEEAEDENSNRRNFVFSIKGKIVGCISFYFQNNGKVGAKFAFRISSSIRGKGFGKHITSLVELYLRKNYPKLESTMSAIPDMDMNDEGAKSPKHGKLLTVESAPVYKIKLEDITELEIKEKDFKVICKKEFAELL